MFTRYFPLDNPNNELQAAIARTIREYYPIGLRAGDDDYNDHPASKKFDKTVSNHMEEYNQYMKPWKSFLKNLPKGYKSKVHNFGFAVEPSYSGKLLLEKYEDESLLRIKELVFNVSWLGKFYTVFGVDETVIKDEGLGYGYSSINVITTSPYREFEGAFNYLQSAIEDNFQGYKFVPYIMWSANIKDVETGSSFGRDATVYDCLFSHLLNTRYLPAIHHRGDYKYGAGKSRVKVRFLPPSSDI